MRLGNMPQEQRAVHRQIAANPETNARDERAKGGEVGGRARGDAEDAGDEEGDLGGKLVEESVSFRSQDTSDGDRDGKGGRMLERWV